MNPSFVYNLIFVLLFALTPFATVKSQTVEEVKTISPHYYADWRDRC
jgi:hypothetical protein